MKRLGGTSAVRGNIDNSLIDYLKWNTSKDILSNLLLLTSNPEILNSENIKEITPWLNYEVKNKENQTLPHNKMLIVKGFTTLKDFFLRGKIMNWEELNARNLNANEKMAYYSVTHSIRKEWKTLFLNSYLLHNRNNPGDNVIDANKFYLQRKNDWEEISALGLKIIFKEITGKIPLDEPPILKKINNFYPVSYNDWKNNFKIIRKVTNYSRFRAFIFRLLHGNLYSAKDLFRFGHRENDECVWCKMPAQSRSHMIFECVVIGHFWDEVYQKFPNFLTPKEERIIKPDNQPLQITFLI